MGKNILLQRIMFWDINIEPLQTSTFPITTSPSVVSLTLKQLGLFVKILFDFLIWLTLNVTNFCKELVQNNSCLDSTVDTDDLVF